MSEFWARKIRTYFARKDANNDGVISKKDIEEMANNVADAENASPQLKTNIRNKFVELWQTFMKSAGSDDKDLTPPIMIASIKQQKNDPEFKKTYLKAYEMMFSLLDHNNDHSLSEPEFTRYFALLGIQDTSFIHYAFQYVDVNKDGKLSVHEYTSAMWKYLTTEDELLIWGPLVD